MKNLTADQIALNAYLATKNAEFEAKCIAEGATCWGLFALTAVDLAEYGVYTVEQYKVWREEQDALIDAKEARKASYGY
jgi:hypothetical protein